jgi:hypothetical protein
MEMMIVHPIEICFDIHPLLSAPFHVSALSFCQHPRERRGSADVSAELRLPDHISGERARVKQLLDKSDCAEIQNM